MAAASLVLFGSTACAPRARPSPAPATAPSLTVDITHVSPSLQSRAREAELTTAILARLLSARIPVQISQSFLEREIAFYECFQEAHPTNAVEQAVVGCLKKSLATHHLDWLCLQSVVPDLAKVDAVSRNVPWLFSDRMISGVGLAETSDSSGTRLDVTVKWDYRRTRAIVARSDPEFVRDVDDGVWHGRGYLWKIDTVLELYRGETLLARKHIPAPEWKSSYSSATGFPLETATTEMLEALKSHDFAKFMPIQPRP